MSITTLSQLLDTIDSMCVPTVLTTVKVNKAVYKYLGLGKVMQDTLDNTFMPHGFMGTYKCQAQFFVSSDANANEVIVTVGDNVQHIRLDVLDKIITSEEEALCFAIVAVINSVSQSFNTAPHFSAHSICYGNYANSYMDVIRSALASLVSESTVPVDRFGKVSASLSQNLGHEVANKMNRDLVSHGSCWQYDTQMDAMTFTHLTYAGPVSRKFPALHILISAVMGIDFEYVQRNESTCFEHAALPESVNRTIAIFRAFAQDNPTLFV